MLFLWMQFKIFVSNLLIMLRIQSIINKKNKKSTSFFLGKKISFNKNSK